MRSVCYDRLLMGARFPDNSFALVSIVHKTKVTDITRVLAKVQKTDDLELASTLRLLYMYGQLGTQVP